MCFNFIIVFLVQSQIKYMCKPLHILQLKLEMCRKIDNKLPVCKFVVAKLPSIIVYTKANKTNKTFFFINSIFEGV